MNNPLPDIVFNVPSAESRVILKEKGSKFVGIALPVTNQIEVNQQLDLIRKNYPDAHHHCYAWQIGLQKKLFKLSDDGEPAHTAGNPIFGQIKAFDLTNVLVIVVRYFGGIKLGVGGLTSAYREVAKQVLQSVPIHQIREEESIWINFNYDNTQVVKNLLHQLNLKVKQQKFSESCEFQLMVSKNEKIYLTNELDKLNAKGIKIKWVME